MKARTRKTRWLLIALFFVLAAAGLTLTRHHRTFVATNVVTTPKHVVLPQPQAVLVAATAGKHTLWTPAGALPADVVGAPTDSNSPQPQQSGHPGAAWDAATTVGGSYEAATSGGSNNTTLRPGNSSSTAVTGHQPQAGAGESAYNGYVPLDCELPAGCGAGTTTAIVSRQPSGTSGGMPGAHDSGSVNQNSDPPSNKDAPAASAPELDPATLAGAVTLLLGSLAVLRSRRVRATR